MAEDNTSQVEEVAGSEGSDADNEAIFADVAPNIEVRPGDAPEEVIGKLRPVCSLADQNYNQILELIKDMKAAENVLHRFHAQDGSVTPEALAAAKERFTQAKQSYLQLGNQINEGIKQVYVYAKSFPEDRLVQDLYKVYLAKLLASLETRNPMQNFVALIAVGAFELQRPDPGIFEEEQDKTAAAERGKKLLEETERRVVMLEVRYQKRLCANRLRQGEMPAKIIGHLTAFSRRDPTDINTYIWLANLLGEGLKKQRDHNTRIGIRDEILDYCKRAFSTIDDYMNLQGMENLNDRDRMRAEYVKTITAIRKPLLAKSS